MSKVHAKPPPPPPFNQSEHCNYLRQRCSMFEPFHGGTRLLNIEKGTEPFVFLYRRKARRSVVVVWCGGGGGRGVAAVVSTNIDTSLYFVAPALLHLYVVGEGQQQIDCCSLVYWLTIYSGVIAHY